MDAMTVLALVGGLVGLVVGAELLVRGAASVAAGLGVDPVVVGLTVVAIGTSAPELAVGLTSSSAGQADLGVGNVIGSNVTNAALVLGAAAVVRPLRVALAVVRLDLPILVAASAVTWAMAADGSIGRTEAGLLLVGFVAYLTWVVIRVRADRRAAAADPGLASDRVASLEHEVEVIEGSIRRQRWWVQVASVVGGLVLLVGGSSWLVDGATQVAGALGVSDLVIGLTVVAVGTSLPELATTVLAARRGQADLAFGNVVGSNLLNLLLVLGATGVVAGGLSVGTEAVERDLPLVVLATVMLLAVAWNGFVISRREGAALLAAYGAYLAYVVLDAADHRGVVVVELAALVLVPLAVGVASIAGLRGWRTYGRSAGRPTRP